MDSPDLIRKKALQHYASADHFDRLVSVTTVPSWIALVLSGLIIVFGFGWALFGSISQTVQGQGILLAEKGSIFSAQGMGAGGNLTSILVQPGESIKKGQIMAYVQNNELRKRVGVQEAYVAQLNSDNQALIKLAQQEIAERKVSTTDTDKNLRASMAADQHKLADIQSTLSVMDKLYSQGLVTRFQLLDVTQSFFNTQSEIQQRKQSLTANQADLVKFTDDWNDRLHARKLKLIEERYNLANLEVQLASNGAILSPVDGIVIDINSNIGDKVDASTTIATIASVSGGLDAIIFVPSETGKLVQRTSRVLISPTDVKREEYGSMIGAVVSVSQYPTNEKSMLALLQNQELVDKFSHEGAPFAVRVTLKKNPNTKSGLAWTSSKGPNMIVTPGTLVTALITVRQQAPITLIIPLFKKVALGY